MVASLLVLNMIVWILIISPPKNALGIENHIKDDENRGVDKITVVVYDDNDDGSGIPFTIVKIQGFEGPRI